jgi:hypothetical protein
MRVITRVLQLGRVVKQVPKMSERSKYVREFRGPRLQCLFRKSLLERVTRSNPVKAVRWRERRLGLVRGPRGRRHRL